MSRTASPWSRSPQDAEEQRENELARFAESELLEAKVEEEDKDEPYVPEDIEPHQEPVKKPEPKEPKPKPLTKHEKMKKEAKHPKKPKHTPTPQPPAPTPPTPPTPINIIMPQP